MRPNISKQLSANLYGGLRIIATLNTFIDLVVNTLEHE